MQNRWKPKESDLNQEMVRAIFDYDAETGLLTRLAGKRTDRVGQKCSNRGSSHGYVRVTIGCSVFPTHRIIFLWWHGYLPRKVDHVNRIRNDNRIANLRPATDTENARNKGVRKNNTSGVTGVCWDRKTKSWHARIKTSEQSINLGHFSDFHEAVRVRREAEHRHFDNFAPIQSPADAGLLH